MGAPFRIAVLISGAGSNLQALIDSASPPVEVAAVASSRAGAGGLERARRAGVPSAVFAIGGYSDRAGRDRALAGWLEDQRIDLVVLAGFMELLGPDFVRRFAGRLVNVHPSLLPAFPGVGALEQALAYGVKVLGVTVHFVDEGVDSGPIVLQEALALTYPARIAEIKERVHRVEHRLLPRAVRLIAEGRVRFDSSNQRMVLIDDVD